MLATILGDSGTAGRIDYRRPSRPFPNAGQNPADEHPSSESGYRHAFMGHQQKRCQILENGSYLITKPPQFSANNQGNSIF
jgi:hypothetical protein